MNKTVGLPRMHKEAGERRDFLPSTVAFLQRVGAPEIMIEDGYGSGMGLSINSYLRRSNRVRVGSHADCLDRDVVAVIRCPDDDALRRMRKGAVLLSMLHYPTRPRRVAMLRGLAIRGVSLDSLTGPDGRRLVESLRAVGWNGIRVAFQELAKRYRRFDDPGRRPIRVTILGAGAVGGHAAHAATRYGDPALRESLAGRGIPGVEVTVIDFDLTGDPNYMLNRLEQTDVLVDATQRSDPSRPVVPNAWIEALPPHTVILDLSVDPYDFSVDPPQVKGIEGVPDGDLDQYVFPPDDAAYDRLDPRIDRTHRRVAVSCYSWPGLDPRGCMEVYGAQVEPILRVLVTRCLDGLRPDCGRFFERAVARADISRWRIPDIT